MHSSARMGDWSPTASDRRGAGRRLLQTETQPGRVQLFALLRERNIPFLVHSCDPITENEFAQVPHVGKPVAPSNIVQVIQEILHLGVKPNLHIVGCQPCR
jgi:hypothetical protein